MAAAVGPGDESGQGQQGGRDVNNREKVLPGAAGVERETSARKATDRAEAAAVTAAAGPALTSRENSSACARTGRTERLAR